MAAPVEMNGSSTKQQPEAAGVAPNTAPKPPRRKAQKPNYAHIHAKPLPLETYPFPAFIPHSPLSLLRIAATLLKQFLSPPNSHPSSSYIGYFSSESRSVHVTDPTHVRALWEMGFFGKGTLSRSEPSWLEREKARLKTGNSGGGTSEEATRKRREERRLFKLERARAEREQIEQQLKQEMAAADPSSEDSSTGNADQQVLQSTETAHAGLVHVFPWQQATLVKEVRESNDLLANDDTPVVGTPAEDVVKAPEVTVTDLPTVARPTETRVGPVNHEEPLVQVNQEHLQLTLEEAFFLTYGLGALEIRASPDSEPVSTTTLFTLSRQHSVFPPTKPSCLRPDDPFLLNYVVYHYYRSLGWVVRPGVKFSVDYLLYNRGPVFSHAEFAVMIIPEYSAATPESERKESKDWWWLHCINRVQSQVRKSLVVCYVEVPSAEAVKAVGEGDIGGVLRLYKVREFVLRRWLANRSRD